MSFSNSNNWTAKDVQDLINNNLLNGIVDDMFSFVEEHPDWNMPSESRTGCLRGFYSQNDGEGIETCLRCQKPLNDPEYAPYLVCGSKCDELNCRDEDEEQQSTKDKENNNE